MAGTPSQPKNPPKGTSPSPSINRAADTSWDSWNQHGNKDPKAAIADQFNKKPVPTGGDKK
jgi:hypothetical protein